MRQAMRRPTLLHSLGTMVLNRPDATRELQRWPVLERQEEVDQRLAVLTRLTLTNFRNFLSLDLALPQGVVAIWGANAQGKSALLEAVYLLAIARSFRAENEREVVNFAAAGLGEPALVGGSLERDGERIQIYVGYTCDVSGSAGGNQEGGAASMRYSVRKSIRVNRIRRTAADLVGTMGAVLFNAEDIELVQGPPAVRRRFLDILISQGTPPYLKALQRYTQVLRQRNRLLRMLRDGRAQADELEFWDDQLVTEGVWLGCQRSQAMAILSSLCAEHNRDLGNPGEVLTLQHLPNVPAKDDPAESAHLFRQALTDRRPREVATGTTTVGPHRDDFKLLVDGVDMGTFASRGQARTLALSLRLAEASYLAQVRQDEPVVLLDDVLSEMDEERRQRVLEKIAGYGQSLITTTDVDQLQRFFGSRASYLRVSDGAVTPMGDS